jgi:hypothetical protein
MDNADYTCHMANAQEPDAGRIAGVDERRGTLSRSELSALVAGCLASVEVGAQTPTVRELAARFGASSGAVHAVLRQLAASGAVVLRGRSRTGTILEMRSMSRLWVEIHQEPMVIALPPAGTPRLQGLATGIKAALAGQNIEAYLTFLRGSRRRVDALRRGACDAVVMSALGASSGACGPGETIAATLPKRTYASRHRVYSRQVAHAARPLRVASDPESADLQSLLAAEYGAQEVEFSFGAYIQFEQLLRAGEVDVVVWDEEEARALPRDIVDRPLAPQADELDVFATQAVVVTRRDDVLTTESLGECLTVEGIVGVQEAVLAGLRLPEY